MKKEEFDQSFDETFERAVEKKYGSPALPDPQNSWHAVGAKLKREKRNRLWKRRLRMVPVALLFFFIGAVVFGNPQVSEAFHPLYRVFQSVQGELVSFFFGTDQQEKTGAKTAPPPQEDTTSESEGISIRKQVSLEEAREAASFHFSVPQTVPAGYELQRVEVFYTKNSAHADMVHLWYTGQGDRSFGIVQKQLGEDFVISSGIDQSAGAVKEVEINGRKAFLIFFADGRTSMKWLINNIHLDIAGDLSEEEMIDLARGLE